MSTKISAICWDLQDLSSSQKLVLISLADQANDEGVCWPSIGSICRRTCLSERAVQNAIKNLMNFGLLVKNERRGRSTVYTVTPAADAPRNNNTPAFAAPTPAPNAPPPPHEVRHPPAADAPHPRTRCTQNRKGTVIEPSVESSKKHKGDARKKKSGNYNIENMDMSSWPSMPDEQILNDWLIVRKAKSAPITQTVINRIGQQLARAVDSGHSVNDCIGMAAERGWRGFDAAWMENKRSGDKPNGGDYMRHDSKNYDYSKGVNPDGSF